MHDIKLMTDKNGPALHAILMAMQNRWYGAEHITQYGRSRVGAALENFETKLFH